MKCLDVYKRQCIFYLFHFVQEFYKNLCNCNMQQRYFQRNRPRVNRTVLRNIGWDKGDTQFPLCNAAKEFTSFKILRTLNLCDSAQTQLFKQGRQPTLWTKNSRWLEREYSSSSPRLSGNTAKAPPPKCCRINDVSRAEANIVLWYPCLLYTSVQCIAF